MWLRSLLFLLGLLLVLPILTLSVLAFLLPITISGVGYLLAGSLAIAGLILAPWASKYSSFLISVGMIGIAFVAGTRLILAARAESSTLRMVTLPQGKETRWMNTLIDEQDSLILARQYFTVSAEIHPENMKD